MFTGHYAAALLARRATPEISLGTATIAAMFADLTWCAFMLAGREHVIFKPGRGAANYLDMPDVALSHSLLTNIVWAGLVAGTWWLFRRSPKGAAVLFAAVLSHWILDVVSHRPDMPLAPGTPLRLGLGLWTSIPATLIVEGGLWLLAIMLYMNKFRPATRVRAAAFWIGAALITLLWWNNIAGPPPPDPKTAPIASLIVFSLTIAWAYWADRGSATRSTA
jgi:hypothetical protein